MCRFYWLTANIPSTILLVYILGFTYPTWQDFLERCQQSHIPRETKRQHPFINRYINVNVNGARYRHGQGRLISWCLMGAERAREPLSLRSSVQGRLGQSLPTPGAWERTAYPAPHFVFMTLGFPDYNTVHYCKKSYHPRDNQWTLALRFSRVVISLRNMHHFVGRFEQSYPSSKTSTLVCCNVLSSLVLSGICSEAKYAPFTALYCTQWRSHFLGTLGPSTLFSLTCTQTPA